MFTESFSQGFCHDMIALVREGADEHGWNGMVGMIPGPRVMTERFSPFTSLSPAFKGKAKEKSPADTPKPETGSGIRRFLTGLKSAVFSPKATLRRVLEDRWFFHPSGPILTPAEVPSDRLRPKIREVFFKTADGVKLHAWHIPAALDAAGKPRPTIVYAHGQSGNLSLRWKTMETFSDAGFGFLAFDYRGYGKSEGESTEKGLYADFDGASDYLTRELGIGLDQQIAMGGSLGGAIAIDSASRKPYRGVLLYATFTSAIEVFTGLKRKHKVTRYIPTVVFSSLLQQRFESKGKMGIIQAPVLIVHGAKDLMMPVDMSRQLLERAIRAPYRDRLVIPEGVHEDLVQSAPGDIVAALETMLRKTGG